MVVVVGSGVVVVGEEVVDVVGAGVVGVVVGTPVGGAVVGVIVVVVDVEVDVDVVVVDVVMTDSLEVWKSLHVQSQ